jgi:hypothetical protein
MRLARLRWRWQYRIEDIAPAAAAGLDRGHGRPVRGIPVAQMRGLVLGVNHHAAERRAAREAAS